jgi:hypothetical protein
MQRGRISVYDERSGEAARALKSSKVEKMAAGMAVYSEILKI